MRVLGYAAVSEHEGLLSSDDDGVDRPLSVHGVFSNFDDAKGIGVSDYQSFSNMSGGAVTHLGKLVGIHLST